MILSGGTFGIIPNLIAEYDHDNRVDIIDASHRASVIAIILAPDKGLFLSAPKSQLILQKVQIKKLKLPENSYYNAYFYLFSQCFLNFLFTLKLSLFVLLKKTALFWGEILAKFKTIFISIEFFFKIINKVFAFFFYRVRQFISR